MAKKRMKKVKPAKKIVRKTPKKKPVKKPVKKVVPKKAVKKKPAKKPSRKASAAGQPVLVDIVEMVTEVSVPPAEPILLDIEPVIPLPE